MKLTMALVVLAGVAFLGAGTAIWAGPNLDVAVPAAGVAVAFALALALLGFQREVRLPKGAESLGDYDSLLQLRTAFQKGVLGRAAIIASVAGLEAELLGPQRRLRTLEEEAALQSASPRAFVQWVEAQLTELERNS